MQDFDIAIAAARFDAKIFEVTRRHDAWSFALSNAQWDEVRKSEDLPEGARKRIDFEIGLYRVGIGEGAASNPQETKANLERALKATSSLRASLQDLNASAYAELVDGKWQNDERLRELAACCVGA